METSPPRFAILILRWFCNIEYLEEIEGDLFEEYSLTRSTKGKFYADITFYRNVLSAIKPYPSFRSNIKTARGSNFDLLPHFFKITWRGVAKNRITSFINITGLTLSITSFLFIALFILDELTFESMHPDADNTYRISHSYKRYGDGAIETDVRVPGNWAPELKQTTPEIEKFARFSRFGYPGSIRNAAGDKVFVEQQIFWTDSTFSELFNISLIGGTNAPAILKQPRQLIINSKTALKYFGSSDPIGQELIYSRDGMDFSFTVMAVMNDFPTNTHFHPDFIASYVALEPFWKRNNEDRINSWRDAFTYSYVTLTPGTNPGILEDRMRKLFKQHLGEDAGVILPVITPLKQIHFTKGYLIELESPGDHLTLLVFITIGTLILIIAVTNYMNLSTARSLKRSKEVGLRKTFGVRRTSLAFQFFGESFMMTTISITLGIVLLAMLLPIFNELSGKRFLIDDLLAGDIFQLIAYSTLAIGFLSGIYPALYLSGFNPLLALKGKLQHGRSAETFRQALVVVQFTITLLLFVGMFVVTGQLSYINENKLNLNDEQIITVRLFEQNLQQLAPFINGLHQETKIETVTAGTQLPRLDNYGWIDTRVKAPALGDMEYIWQHVGGDYFYPKMFNMEVVSGRLFNQINITDSSAVLINETALKDLGISKEQAIGLILENPNSNEEYQVIGVVKDFHYTTVKRKILPLMVTSRAPEIEAIYVKVHGHDPSTTIDFVQNQWRKFFPLTPFEYWFIDDEFERMYKSENQIALMIKYFSILAIIVACLGLFGLAVFMAEQKTKEIGIRKVLGASTWQVLFMLSLRFSRLIAIAMIIGIPIAYFACNMWLETFVYKIDINASFFIIAIALIFFVTMLTVGIESLKAARANPVESIRTE
jgi:putative ABC transport system permease protein